MDVDLATAGVTKGGLCGHLDDKEALGYAVVDEIAASLTREKWVRPSENTKNPIDTLIRIVESTSLKREDLQRGCPLNDLFPRDVAPQCGIPQPDGVPLPQFRRVEIMLMRFAKHRRNGTERELLAFW